MLKSILSLLFGLLCFGGFTQINWKSTESIEQEFQNRPKYIMVYIHTDWCKICKMQENTVFADDSLSQMINDRFYPLELDAETKTPVIFFGRSYAAATNNSHHEMARYFGSIDGQLSFPTTLILDSRFQVVFRKSGLLSKEGWFELFREL